MNAIQQIDSLAKRFLTNAEYVRFVDLMTAINDRLGKSLEKQEASELNQTDSKELKYPHDIELSLAINIFRNSQIGERVELVDHLETVLLKKLPIPQDPIEYAKALQQNLKDIL